MRLAVLLLGAWLSFTAVLPACADEPGQIDVGGLTCDYLLHLPPSLSAHPALIMVFHGGGGTAAQIARLTQFDAVSDQDGFVVVYPQGLQRHWNDGRPGVKDKVDDVGFVAALLARLASQYGVDPKRIYATGLSNGAIFSNYLGCRLAGQIAGIAPVAGSLPVGPNLNCAPAHPVSVLFIAGMADPVVPYDGGAVRNFHGLGIGGAVLGAPRSFAFWKIVDDCQGTSAPSYPPPLRAGDPTRLEIYDAQNCKAGTAVRLIGIEGAGHIWPGGAQYLPRFIIGAGSWQLDASAAIADFFLAHPGS